MGGRQCPSTTPDAPPAMRAGAGGAGGWEEEGPRPPAAQPQPLGGTVIRGRRGDGHTPTGRAGSRAAGRAAVKARRRRGLRGRPNNRRRGCHKGGGHATTHCSSCTYNTYNTMYLTGPLTRQRGSHAPWAVTVQWPDAVPRTTTQSGKPSSVAPQAVRGKQRRCAGSRMRS